MRYFFVAFSFNDPFRSGRVNMGFEADGFPSNNEMRKITAKAFKVPAKGLVITNIYEFDNEDDFRSFWGTSATPPDKPLCVIKGERL